MSDRSHDQSGETILSEAKTALIRGRRQQARRLLQSLTDRVPANEEAWLWRAAAADTAAEQLLCLSKVLELAPQHARAERQLLAALKARLDDVPVLLHLHETDHLYLIQTGDGLELLVPKQRAVPERYPPSEPSHLDQAERWLAWAALGLLPAGLGAHLFAPLTIAAVLRARRQELSEEEARRGRLLLRTGLLIWAVAWLWAALFLVHI
ncbi:MAG: hypothetical protein R3300_06855 [Candidatus Promineifilaceae bacterium]|nr:hypothetical protein [Candidatus Promineifilaceae bacterium]